MNIGCAEINRNGSGDQRFEKFFCHIVGFDGIFEGECKSVLLQNTQLGACSVIEHYAFIAHELAVGMDGHAAHQVAHIGLAPTLVDRTGDKRTAEAAAHGDSGFNSLLEELVRNVRRPDVGRLAIGHFEIEQRQESGVIQGGVVDCALI